MDWRIDLWRIRRDFLSLSRHAAVHRELFRRTFSGPVLVIETFAAFESGEMGHLFSWVCDCNARTAIVPATVHELSASAFKDARQLESLTFEAPSTICWLRPGTFRHCQSIKSIVIPASVQAIMTRCFVDVYVSDARPPIETLAFEPGSRLETIQWGAFSGCYSLRNLVLASASNLVNLEDLPPAPGVITVPDSVEIIWVRGRFSDLPPDPSQVLFFGCDSKLAAITIDSGYETGGCPKFLQISSCALKRFRLGLEFQTPDDLWEEGSGEIERSESAESYQGNESEESEESSE